MNKKELRKQLSDLYLEGMLKNFWEISDKGKPTGYLSFNSSVTGVYGSKLDEAEKPIYNRILLPEEMIKKVPWKQAVENYNKIKNSPLLKALKEGENK